MPPAWWAAWPWMHLAGRVLLGAFPVAFGLWSLVRLPRAAAYLDRKGVPGPRPVALYVGVMLFVGGAFVLTGWHRFVGSGMLFLVLFPGAFALHPFWSERDPDRRLDEAALFFMTLALAGAALLTAYYSYQTWPFSIAG